MTRDGPPDSVLGEGITAHRVKVDVSGNVKWMDRKKNTKRFLVGGLKPVLQGEWKGVKWIRLAQDMDKWRDLVNAIVNLRVP